jgi:hypothetical protein
MHAWLRAAASANAANVAIRDAEQKALNNQLARQEPSKAGVSIMAKKIIKATDVPDGKKKWDNFFRKVQRGGALADLQGDCESDKHNAWSLFIECGESYDAMRNLVAEAKFVKENETKKIKRTFKKRDLEKDGWKPEKIKHIIDTCTKLLGSIRLSLRCPWTPQYGPINMNTQYVPHCGLYICMSI